MGIIRAEKLKFDYVEPSADENSGEEITHALRGIDLDVAEGSFIAILGHNGCGKSTLAKQINALLVPTSGTVWIDSMDTADDDNLWKIRQEAGMVFQNPDNQIISSVVEEDVGFGPENLGVPTDEIWSRVDRALEMTGMTAFRKKDPDHLSGGQKQRVAIAGVMAMKPKCIVLDEPTAMLDPSGRIEVIRAVRDLNRQEKVTVILITHYMEEVVDADRLFVMDEGKIVMEGTPREIFSQADRLRELRLGVPQATLLAHELIEAGVPLDPGILSRDELVGAVMKVREEKKSQAAGEAAVEPAAGKPDPEDSGEESHPGEDGSGPGPEKKDPEEWREKVEKNIIRQAGYYENNSPENRPQKDTSIALEDVSYIYGKGTAGEVKALDHISLTIPQGEFVGIIGHTGSGKSTLVQHFNALLRPTEGRVLFHGEDVWEDGYDRRNLRFRVGLVFQYPEHQLFETDVLTDVCFGPKNQGLSPEECKREAVRALRQVGLPEELYDSSPFRLSGGQKRRAAIAGVLAMNPDVMILDEPTAGLDPLGKEEMFEVIRNLQRDRNMTILLVSHSMEDVARYVDRIVVVDQGKKAYDGTPKEVFSHYRELEQIGLAAPQAAYIVRELAARGLPVDPDAVTVAEARDTILRALAG